MGRRMVRRSTSQETGQRISNSLLSREESEMLKHVPALLACSLLFPACLFAARIKGKVVDPSGAAIGGAQIAIVNRVGVVAQTTATAAGAFQLDAPDNADARLVVTAPGFAMRTLSLNAAERVQLEIAPRVDAVQVAGSTIELPAEAQGSSIDVIPVQQLRQRNEPFAVD